MLRRSLFRLVGAGLLVWLAAGCAALDTSARGDTPARETLEHFALDGRFSLMYEAKSYSGRLSWTYRGAASELLLSSPFGQGLAEIVTDAQGARLVGSDGKLHVAPNADSLTQDVLGFPLPLARMADWMRGRVVPGQSQVDRFGRALSLTQEAWRIDYEYADENPRSAPVRIRARRADSVELRVFVDAWRSLSSEETNP